LRLQCLQAFSMNKHVFASVASAISTISVIQYDCSDTKK